MAVRTLFIVKRSGNPVSRELCNFKIFCTPKGLVLAVYARAWCNMGG